MKLTPEEIEQLADEMVGAEGEGLNDRKAFLRTWRRFHRRFEAIWDPDEIDQQTIRYEVARVLARAYEKHSEMLRKTEQWFRVELTGDSIIRLDDLTRLVFNC